MSVSHLLRSFVPLLLAYSLAACGESPSDVEVDPDGGPVETPDGEPAPPPPMPAAVVPDRSPVIYIATSSDASVFDRYTGMVIEGSRGAFVQLEPATQEAVLVHTSSSVSWAESRTTLHTFDDEIYLLNASETGARVKRLDKDDLRSGPVSGTPVPAPRSTDSVEEDCFVVHGDDLIYKVAYRRASFPGNGWADGPLVRVPNFFGGGREVQEIMPGLGGDSPTPGGFVTAACQFKMDWADGVWYDVSSRPVEDRLGIFERDPATGEPTVVAALGGISSLESSLSLTNIAFDRGSAYFAALDVATQRVAVVSLRIGDPQWVVAMERQLDGRRAIQVHSLDVDDGYVGFVLRGESSQDAVALYSSDSDSFQSIYIGDSVNQLQVLYRDGG